MSEYLELSLDMPINLLAKQIKDEIPRPIIEKFKEGLRSMKRVNPAFFEDGLIKLRDGDIVQAYNMGCYARIKLGGNSRILLELLF